MIKDFCATTVILAAACCGTGLSAVETVRVDVSAGVPQLRVDGRPGRARMFWGAPGVRPQSTGPAAQEITFEFSPAEDEPDRATMHLRFGSTPGDVYLDDIQLVDLQENAAVIFTCGFETGPESFRNRWTFWPTGSANTTGKVEVQPGCGRGGSAGLHIQLQAPPDGRWPDFHIDHLPNLSLRRGHQYRVSLWVRAEPARPLTIAFYRPGNPFVYLGGPSSPFVNQIKMAAGVGVNFVSFPVSTPWSGPAAELAPAHRGNPCVVQTRAPLTTAAKSAQTDLLAITDE